MENPGAESRTRIPHPASRTRWRGRAATYRCNDELPGLVLDLLVEVFERVCFRIRHDLGEEACDVMRLQDALVVVPARVWAVLD